MQGDSVYMARTIAKPNPATINNAAHWEFYAGNGRWNATVADARPIFVWPGRTGVVTVSWHSALQKHLMLVSTPRNGCSTVGDFDTYMLEADLLTGPYKLVTYMRSFGPQAYFVNVPTKFMGTVNASRYDFILSYSANFASNSAPNPVGSGYHWSLLHCRLNVSSALSARLAGSQLVTST